MANLLDTHFHFDFIRDSQVRQEFLAIIGQKNFGLVAQTVKPSEFLDLQTWHDQNEAISNRPLLSLGFHPWWLESQAQAKEEIQIFKQAVSQTAYIGEIGLDFVPKRLAQASRDLQVNTFRQLIDICCQSPKDQAMVMSIHAVWSEDQVLTILEDMEISKQGLIPILHRFNGNHQELLRLLDLGGYISVHPQMLRTKKGRAYLKQIPSDRLLLETDLPEGPMTGTERSQAVALADQVVDSLQGTLDKLTELRQEPILPAVLANQEILYGLWTK